MSKTVLHTLFLSLAVSLTFLWHLNQSLAPYHLQIVGLLTLLYFGAKLLSSLRASSSTAIDVVVFTVLILLLVLSTGGPLSPLFFLLYFLLFTLSLLFNPGQAIVISLLLLFYFGLDLRFKFASPVLINLATLLLIAPLASIFGRKFLETQVEAGKIQLLDQIVSAEETSTLIWLSTKAKPTLINLLDTTSLIIGSNLLPFSLQQKLKDLHQALVILHQSANSLEKEIDTASDV